MAMAKLGSLFLATCTVQNWRWRNTGRGDQRAPQAQGPLKVPPQSSGGMRRAEYTITRLSLPAGRPAEGKGGESWAG